MASWNKAPGMLIVPVQTVAAGIFVVHDSMLKTELPGACDTPGRTLCLRDPREIFLFVVADNATSLACRTNEIGSTAIFDGIGQRAGRNTGCGSTKYVTGSRCVDRSYKALYLEIVQV
jgi:hypothetical protein